LSRTTVLMRNFGGDARFSLRQFRRAPGYAAFTVLVLALGIGTVTAMFTVSYTVLLKPLPFAADRSLFQPVEKNTSGTAAESMSFSEIKAWQYSTKGTADVAFSRSGLNIADGPAGAVLITEVDSSQNLFEVLGTGAIMGRGFLPGEQEGLGSRVVILSHALWEQSFAGDKDVLGKTLHIGGVPRTVIGVMSPQFTYPLWEGRPQAWVPVDRIELTSSLKDDAYSTFSPLLRIKPNATKKQVESQLEQAHAQFAKSHDVKIELSGLRELLVADMRSALLALEVAVIVVWLIACSNVASLLLARVVSRRSEIAVRAALGAARNRIVLQFLSESLVLSCVGAAAGLGLATVMLRIFSHTLTKKLPLGMEIHFNWAVWTVLLVLTLITTVAFGAAPALMASRTEMDALKGSGRKAADDRGQNRIRGALLVGQVALSITLLISAGLMLRTMYALRHVPLGFRTDHLLLTSLTIPNDLYRDRNVGTAVWQPLIDEVRHLPGVRAAALSTVLPIEHPVELITSIYATEWMKQDGNATVRAATPGLMDALSVRIRSGRFFTEDDTATSLPVMVVNQTFVNRYLGGGSALGKQIRYGHIPRTATIVGVIEDVHQDGVSEESQPEFYLCMSQIAQDQQIYRALLGRFMQVAVRTDIAPDILIPEIRRGIQKANPHLAIGECSTMAEAVEDSIGSQKLAAQVITVFGVLVLLTTVVGLYGLLNYLVTHRTQEIGIRMALGADRARVVSMILRQTLIWLGMGSVIGIGLAVVGGRLLDGFLFGVPATDPWTIGFVSISLALCGLLAAMVPARRAASVNPVDALRAE
jgi:predicted permease